MLAIGTTDLRDKDVQIVVLKREDNYVKAESDLELPRGQRADQVLTSFLFDLPTTTDDRTKEDIHRYVSLNTRLESKQGKLSEVEGLKLEELTRAAAHSDWLT